MSGGTGRPELALHIGAPKTGTSSIQQFLLTHRDRLTEAGYRYPTGLGPARHTRFGMAVMPDEELVEYRTWKRSGQEDPDGFRRRIRRRLRNEITGSGCRHVTISDEGLFVASAAQIARIRPFVAPLVRSVRLVAYLRRQDDHLISNYQQHIKMGGTVRLADLARGDLASTYDYAQRLTLWRDGLDPDTMVVRPFEPARFAGGSIYQDFFDAAGIALDAADFAAPDNQNESVSAEAVEVLRLLNVHGVHELGLSRWQLDHRDMTPRLAGVGGAPLGLPSDDREAFMARWQDANDAVATRFLGGSTLFTAPPKTNVVTEQRLDPARLEPYLELLEVPEAHWPALRRIAEREANAG